MNRGRALAVLAAVALLVAAYWMRSPPPPAAPIASRDAAVATPHAPATDASVTVIVRPDVPAAHDVVTTDPVATVVVRGAWGTRLGEFGHTSETEANPEGPMALTVAPDGEVAVLDPRNRRVQRFGGGAVTAADLPAEAVQDLARLPDGRLIALDRLGAASVTVLERDGRAGATIPLRGGAITEGGAVTGVFADADGIYVEREHREVVRIADASGREDPARPTLWGRPSRDGAQLLRAAMENRALGTVRVTVAARENGAVDWSTVVPLGAAVVYLAMLDSDAAGRVYVAAEVGEFTEDGVRNARVMLARLNRAGVVDGTLRLPAMEGGDEVFRPMCVDDAGAVYVMVPGRDGLEVRRYELPR